MNDSSGDDVLGVKIAGRYWIISQIAAGGMGTAYRAWDEQGGLPVVIKIPKKAFLEDPKFAERFQREIRLLQGFVHPHIVPIVDVGERDGLPFVVMRFLPGGSLSNRRLRDDKGQPRPNPPAALHLWLPAVAAALDYIHAQGVVHRDVKPANIFFDAFWGAYLGDFGIAKVVTDSDSFDREHTLTATHMGIGTPEYMAPEQFMPKALVDGRVDQYALGVIVYEMLAGERPFTGATAHLIVEVTTLPVPPLPVQRSDVSPRLVEAVRRALSKRPDERFQTCSEFASEVLRGVPAMAGEQDVARLLCPRCSNMLKLPTAAAGRKGKCPKCKTEMRVADDLGALWLLDEAQRQRRVAGSAVGEGDPKSNTIDIGEVGEAVAESIEVFKPVSSTTPIRKGSGDGQSRLAMGGLCLFICLWLTTPVASVGILESVLLLVHRTRILGYDSRLVFFSWCCVAGVVAFYTWALPSSLRPLRVLYLTPRILIAAVAGLIGLIGSAALTRLFYLLFSVPFLKQMSWELFYAGTNAAWIGLVVTGVVWLRPIGGRGTVLPRWFGNPTHGSRVLFAATLAFVAVFIAQGVALSRPEPPHPPPLSKVITSENGLVTAKQSRIANPSAPAPVVIDVNQSEKLASLAGEAAKALAQHKGQLGLNGLTTLSDEAAQALRANPLVRLPERIAKPAAIKAAEAPKATSDKSVDQVSKPASLTVEQAKALARSKGRAHLIGPTTLSDEAAKALAQRKGDLYLNGLTTLSDEAAKALAQQEGDLGLNGLTTLSDEAAKALAKHEGQLFLEGLTALSDEAAKALRANPSVTLPNKFKR